MNYSKIRQLLDRFYKGETSLEEEALLRNFFAQEKDTEPFRTDRQLFNSLSEITKEEVLGEDFDQAILAQIEEKSTRLNRRRLIYSFSGLAAAAMIVLAVWMGGLFSPQAQLVGTINNPQLAFAQTKKALKEVSQNLNKGLAPVKTATADFNKPLQQLAKIDKMETSLKEVERIRGMEKARRLMQSINGVYINLEPNKNNK